jgi:hypothetical protein
LGVVWEQELPVVSAVVLKSRREPPQSVSRNPTKKVSGEMERKKARSREDRGAFQRECEGKRRNAMGGEGRTEAVSEGESRHRVCPETRQRKWQGGTSPQKKPESKEGSPQSVSRKATGSEAGKKGLGEGESLGTG